MPWCFFILHFSAQHIPGVTAYTEAAHAHADTVLENDRKGATEMELETILYGYSLDGYKGYDVRMAGL